MGEVKMSARAVPQLVQTVSFEELPWLLPAFRKLDELLQEGGNIPGVGDLRISSETSLIVRRLLSHIKNERLSVPQFAPISGGGVGVSWNWRDMEVSFKVFPSDDEVVFVVTDARDQVVSDGAFNFEQTDAMATALNYLAAS
jgi:hypothetical protein